MWPTGEIAIAYGRKQLALSGTAGGLARFLGHVTGRGSFGCPARESKDTGGGGTGGWSSVLLRCWRGSVGTCEGGGEGKAEDGEREGGWRGKRRGRGVEKIGMQKKSKYRPI